MCERGNNSESTLTLKFSFVSHGSNYDNVHIPSVTLFAMSTKKRKGKLILIHRSFHNNQNHSSLKEQSEHGLHHTGIDGNSLYVS